MKPMMKSGILALVRVCVNLEVIRAEGAIQMARASSRVKFPLHYRTRDETIREIRLQDKSGLEMMSTVANRSQSQTNIWCLLLTTYLW